MCEDSGYKTEKSYEALLLIKKCLAEVNIEVSRFLQLKCVREESSYMWCKAKKANHDPISSGPVEPVELDILGSVLRVNQ